MNNRNYRIKKMKVHLLFNDWKHFLDADSARHQGYTSEEDIALNPEELKVESGDIHLDVHKTVTQKAPLELQGVMRSFSRLPDPSLLLPSPAICDRSSVVTITGMKP